jgi:hypothetical protein
VESKTPHVRQPWMVGLVDGGGSIGGYSSPPPNTAGIIAQLKREGLITARRESSGTVVIEVRRTAGELADVDGMSFSVGPGGMGGDPITGLATQVTRGGGDESTPITARLTIARDGSLRNIRVSARTKQTLPDGHGGATVLADTVMEWKLSPPTTTVQAPDPHDVMVVGDVLQTRRGATGFVGPQRTLDTYSQADLRALKRAMGAHSEEFTAFYRNRPASPKRDYSKLMRMVTHNRNLLKSELAGMARTPAELARNERCQPYWPASGRAMDADTARAQPASAGWRCHLTSVDAYVSTEPKVTGWAWEFVGPGGGGCCFTERDIARATR